MAAVRGNDRGVTGSVDPAALLIAVFAVGSQALLSAGAWEPINTVVALIVAAVVALYMWPSRNHVEPFRHLVAQSLVYGFVAAIACAWPIQSFLVGGQECKTSPIWTAGLCTDVNSPKPTYATFWALLPGVLAFLLCLWAMVKTRRANDDGSD